MGEFTTTTHAKFIPEVWSKDILDEVEKRLVMTKLVSHDYEGDIQEFGDVVHIPSVAGLSVGSKSADTDVTFEADTEDEKTITIDQWKYAAFKIPDMVKIQSRYDLRAIYSKRASYALAKNIDSAIYTQFYADVTQTAGASDDTATEADASLLEAIRLLDAADAPEEDRNLVVHPGEKKLLMTNEKFTDASVRGDGANPVAKGFFAEVYGLPGYWSTQVGTTGTKSNNLVFHKEVVGVAVQQQIRVQADYNIRSLSWEVVADVLYGVDGLRPTFGVELAGPVT